MKKVTTILKQINKLEDELNSKYSPEEIIEGFEKLYKEGFYFSLNSLVELIYEDIEKSLKSEHEFPDKD